MSEWGSWGSTSGGGEPPPPAQPWGTAPPPPGPYDPPPYQPQPQQPGPYQQPPPYQPDPYPPDAYQPDYYGQQPSGGWPAGPPPSGGGPSKGPLIAIVAVLAVVLLGGAAFIFMSGDDDDGDQAGTDTTAPGASTTVPATAAPTTAPGGEVDVFTLGVGQCWTDETNADSLESVTVIPCDQPHEYEVYDAFDLSFSEYPGEDAINTAAETDCTTRFETFIGIPYEDSQYSLSTLTPSEESWADGDREVLCSVFDQRGPTTGSLEGAAT